MTPEEAEKIINRYGEIVAKLPQDELASDVMKLPYSVGKIRYAYFLYTATLIEENMFDDTIKQNLEMTYAMLDTKFIEEPEEVNKAYKQYTKDEKAREIIQSKGGLAAFMPSTKKMVEYHNFVVDCYGNWGK